MSHNLVDWHNLGIEPGLSAIPEPYGTSSPCSGFMVVDDDGTPCAGFRECGGQWPGRSNVQVPLELRCAKNAELTAWTGPEYIFWFYFNRPLPYDPVRPWKDLDGKWYATISADACNATHTPCSGGGAEYLFTSPVLHGRGADWQPLGIMFASNWTVLSPYVPDEWELDEFVTAGYFGNLTGDPRHGATRCLTNNVARHIGAATSYFCGTQLPGKALVVDYTDPVATGLIDWGALQPANNGKTGVAALEDAGGGMYTMARTLSPGSPNQVAHGGRKIITAWVPSKPVPAQALPRDLSLDPATGALLQQFVPELQVLRVGSGDPSGLRSQALEVVADFTIARGAEGRVPPFGITVLASGDGTAAVPVTVTLASQLVTVGGRGGPLLGFSPGSTIRVHVIVDHSIVTAIFNNRTGVTKSVWPLAGGDDELSLFGVDGEDVTCVWRGWALRNASFT